MTDIGIEDDIYGGVAAEAADELQAEFAPVEQPSGRESKEEKPPKPVGRRKSAASLITGLWGGAGTLMANSGYNVPVGRTLKFQAPLAGTRLDDMLAHTWLDRFLQPLIGNVELMEGIGAIVAMPLLVGAINKNNALIQAPFVGDIFEQIVMASLEEMVPIEKAKKNRRKKSVKAMAELTEVFEFSEDVDPVEQIFNMIFNGTQAPPVDAPETPVE